jgi:hypothetical protein
LKQHSNSAKENEQRAKRMKSRAPVQRETREVMTELVDKLSRKMGTKASSADRGEGYRRGEVGPNLDRLTVGVDLGDQWSNYCILGLEGETLGEGQLRTRLSEVAEFFGALTGARVVIEVGTIRPGCEKRSQSAGTRCWWRIRG